MNNNKNNNQIWHKFAKWSRFFAEQYELIRRKNRFLGEFPYRYDWGVPKNYPSLWIYTLEALNRCSLCRDFRSFVRSSCVDIINAWYLTSKFQIRMNDSMAESHNCQVRTRSLGEVPNDPWFLVSTLTVWGRCNICTGIDVKTLCWRLQTKML